jgi:hypothetical protein
VRFRYILAVLLACLAVSAVLTSASKAQEGATGPLAAAKNVFFIREGNYDNYLYQGADCAAHVIVTNTGRKVVYVVFPAGNSGVTFPVEGLFEKEELRLEIVGDLEEVSESAFRGVAFDLATNQAAVRLDLPVMDSARYLRALPYPRRVEKIDALRREFLKAAHLTEEGYLKPLVTLKGDSVTYTSKTLDDRNTLRLTIGLPEGVLAGAEKERVTLRSESGKPVRARVTVYTDYEPLHPWGEDDLLNDECARYRQRLSKESPVAAKRFDEALRAFAFLSYREKFLAGSWRYLTYFGRDTMMTLMILYDCVKTDVYESAMASVLDRVSDRGEVAHEEDIGSQAILRRIPDFIASPGTVERSSLAEPVYDYKMVDDDFMLPLMVEMYLGDSRVPESRKLKFLESLNRRGEKNIVTLLRNFSFVIDATKSGALIRLREGEAVGDWRDSLAGLGGGVLPGSVNVGLVHGCLFSIRNIIEKGVYSKADLEATGAEIGLPSLGPFLKEPRKMDGIIDSWRKARRRFLVTVPPSALARRVREYIEDSVESNGERKCLLGRSLGGGITIADFVYRGAIPDELKNGLSFYALSLDADERPIEVPSSDCGFLLFHDWPEPDEIRMILSTINLPFPVGLAEEGGILTANPVPGADRSLLKTLDRNAYHGMVVWSWQMALLEKGLLRQIRRFSSKAGNETLVKEMGRTLLSMRRRQEVSAGLVNSELWTHSFAGGSILPVAYGKAGGSETESNPVQLWSTVGISVMRELDDLSSVIGRP